MNYIEILLVPTAVSTLLVSGIIYLCRTWITERLTQSIRHEYDTKLSKLRSELKLKTQLGSKLFDYQRTEELQSIKEINNAAAEFNANIENYAFIISTSDIPHRDKEAPLKSLINLRQSTLRRKIYLPEDFADITDELVSKAYDLCQTFMELEVEKKKATPPIPPKKWTAIVRDDKHSIGYDAAIITFEKRARELLNTTTSSP